MPPFAESAVPSHVIMPSLPRMWANLSFDPWCSRESTLQLRARRLRTYSSS